MPLDLETRVLELEQRTQELEMIIRMQTDSMREIVNLVQKLVKTMGMMI